MPEPTADAWAQIRYDYEHTDRPVEDICAEHGVSSGTLRDRMRRWQWKRRRTPIPRQGPPAIAVPLADTAPPGPRLPGDERDAPQQPAFPALPVSASEDASQAASGAAAEADAASIVPRLQSAVARVLPAIEAIIARLAAGPHHPREMEQAGRALGALTRTLRELNALLSQQNALVGNAYDDDMPEDMDAFRLDLARRIEAFVASRTGEGAGDEANTRET